MAVAPFGDYAVWCPTCQVPAGERCTQPTDNSRVAVSWTHVARHAEATKQAELRKEVTP